MIEAKQVLNEFLYGAKLGAGEVLGAGSSWGSQTIVLSVHSNSLAASSATLPVVIGPASGAPVAATIKYVQIMPTNNTNAVWEIASSTNTKAFVIGSTSVTLGVVVGATSILNVGVAAGEVLNLSTVTAGGSATVVIGLETAN